MVPCMKTQPVNPYKPKKPFGLGDLVEKIAQPIAKVSDAVLKTNLTNCRKCGERKERLNAFLSIPPPQ